MEDKTKKEEIKKGESVKDSPTPPPTEVPTPPKETEEKPKSKVEKDIAKKLGEGEEEQIKEESTDPKPKTPASFNVSDFSVEQIQELQELFDRTPRKKKSKDSFNTVELRNINNKIVVEFKDTYLDLRADPVNRREIMKAIIPVRFNGEDKFIDILWKEDFMGADKVTCRILKIDKEEKSKVVGTTYKRDEQGGLTSQEVEMYVNEIVLTLTVQLPSGEEIVINGKYVN